ncbi:MAG: acyl-CoA carboxylase subunit epsilon [Thermocrispum sp.]
MSEQPILRVVRGAPDDVELAALTAALTAATASAAPADDTPAQPSAWADVAPRLRQPPRPGPGAWQASGMAR